MRYHLKLGIDLLLSILSMIGYKLIYGRGSLRGPILGLGKRLDLNIRNGGTLRFGDIRSRGGLNVFCDGGNIVFGDGVFFNRNCSINSMKSIVIGSDTLLGEGVKIYDHNHFLDESGAVDKSLFDIESIAIGCGCWIGSNVVILKGVSICDRVVIGANSVVTKSITESGVYVASSSSLLRRIG
jgi:acetyltransferase-like isoleucine patch superfamily enzyme